MGMRYEEQVEQKISDNDDGSIHPDDVCPGSPTGRHEPSWGSVTIESDGDELYVDVNCRHCGRSGCIGTSKTLAENISW
jgi:hypothetical protein